MDIDKSLANIKKFEDTVAACNRCGFCTSYCPTYNVTGNEIFSPRGRNQLFRALIEKKVSNPALAKESIDTCLLCGECTSVCFSEVPTAKLMMEARHFLNQTQGVHWALQFFLNKILIYPKRYKLMLRILFFSKNLGIAFLFKKTGILKKFFPMLDAADSMLLKAPGKFLLDYPEVQMRQESTVLELSHAQALKKETTPNVGRPKVAYMPVCGSQYLRSEIGLATLRLFDRMKLDLVVPEVICCGLPAASYGVQKNVQMMAKENIERLEKGRFEAIVVDDSSCTAHLKDLPSFFQNDPNWIKRAHEISQKIRELSSTLLQRGLKEHLRLAPWLGGKVAYHDPCKAQYAQKIINPPRELLASIPRLELVPVIDADQCCGGAGTYSFTQPELSRAVVNSKTKNMISSGASIVVTSSASCQAQLAMGLRLAGSKIEVLHLSEFLLRALDKRR